MVTVIREHLENYLTAQLPPGLAASSDRLSPELRAVLATGVPLAGETAAGGIVLSAGSDIEATQTRLAAMGYRSNVVGEPIYVFDELLLSYAVGPGELPADLDVAFVDDHPARQFATVRIPTPVGVDTLTRLEALPWVTKFQTNRHVFLDHSEPEGPLSALAPALDTLATSSSSIVTAVIDLGASLADLDAFLWRNPLEDTGVTGVDDDGNDRVDDVHGFNFCSNTGSIVGQPNSHGTSTATVVGAPRAVPGLDGSWMVQVMMLQAFDSGSDVGLESRVVKALDYARNNGARVVNASWGRVQKVEGDEYPYELKVAVQQLVGAGCLLVCSAGKKMLHPEGGDLDQAAYCPAAYAPDHVLSVLAVTDDNTRDPDSNFGRTRVHIGAPATVPERPGFSGTSAAAAQVSRAAALAWEGLIRQGRVADAATVRQLLLDSALRVPELECQEGRVLSLTFLADLLNTPPAPLR